MKPSRIVIATIALCLAGPAAAEDRAAAEQFYRLGAEAYRGGKFDVAATNFDSAYENLAAPEIAFSAAQAHRLQYDRDRRAWRLQRAVKLYRAYVDGAPDGAKRRDAQIYLERLDGLIRQLGPDQLEAVQQKPAIYVSIAPDHARVTVDGKPIEINTPVEVTQGEHVVAASADGYLPRERKIRVGNGQLTVPFELAPRPATLEIKSQPDARITVDGRPVLLRGMTTEVPAGTRWITVSARGKRPISREVTLQPGERLSLDAPLQPTAQRRAVRGVLIGAGALLAGSIGTATAAIVYDFRAADLRDREPLLATEVDDYQRARDRRDVLRTTSLVLGGVSLATAAVAAVMYYTDEPAPDAPLRQIEDRPGGGFAPIALGGVVGLGYAGGF